MKQSWRQADDKEGPFFGPKRKKIWDAKISLPSSPQIQLGRPVFASLISKFKKPALLWQAEAKAVHTPPWGCSFFPLETCILFASQLFLPQTRVFFTSCIFSASWLFFKAATLFLPHSFCHQTRVLFTLFFSAFGFFILSFSCFWEKCGRLKNLTDRLRRDWKSNLAESAFKKSVCKI